MDKLSGYEQTKCTNKGKAKKYEVNDWLFFFRSPSTCLTISVLSLHGVVPASLSPSSWTIMVFTDSVSPLLSREELQVRGGEVQHKRIMFGLQYGFTHLCKP